MSESYLRRSRAVAALILTSQQLFKAVTALVRRHDLTESQYNALRILRGAAKRDEKLTQAELAQRLIASRANTTWILDKLEARDMIRRKGHTDRRKNLVEITPTGQKLLTKIDPEFENLLGTILEDVSTSELQTMLGIIGKFHFD